MELRTGSCGNLGIAHIHHITHLAGACGIVTSDTTVTCKWLHIFCFVTSEGPTSSWGLRLAPNVFAFLSGIS